GGERLSRYRRNSLAGFLQNDSMTGEECRRGHRLEEHPDVAAGNLIDPVLDQQDDRPMLLAALRQEAQNGNDYVVIEAGTGIHRNLFGEKADSEVEDLFGKMKFRFQSVLDGFPC